MQIRIGARTKTAIRPSTCSNMLPIVIILSSVIITLAKQSCQVFPNYNTGAYTYTVCNETQVKDLDTSRAFCKEKGSDVVTFPNYEEYHFIISQINETYNKETFRYTLGIIQKSDGDKYNPETGEFYWITDETTVITNESQTYWEPIKNLILHFDSQPLSARQVGTWMLNLDGTPLPGVGLTGGISLTDHYGDVICVKEGVPTIPPSISTPQANVDNGEEGFQYWIVITVAAVVIVLGVLLAAIIFCVYRRAQSKKENSQKFIKVPQNDTQPPPQCQV